MNLENIMKSTAILSTLTTKLHFKLWVFLYYNNKLEIHVSNLKIYIFILLCLSVMFADKFKI